MCPPILNPTALLLTNVIVPPLLLVVVRETTRTEEPLPDPIASSPPLLMIRSPPPSIVEVPFMMTFPSTVRSPEPPKDPSPPKRRSCPLASMVLGLLTVSVMPPWISSDTLLWTVMLLMFAVTSTLTVPLLAGMMTSSLADKGTPEGDQFEGVFQPPPLAPTYVFVVARAG